MVRASAESCFFLLLVITPNTQDVLTKDTYVRIHFVDERTIEERTGLRACGGGGGFAPSIVHRTPKLRSGLLV